jgi:hypothetical protein
MAGSLKVSDAVWLPQESVTQTFALLAKRGVGKTYTALVMVEEFLKAALPVCVIDPIGVCWGLRASADGKSEGLPIVVLGGDHGDVPLEVTAGETIATLIAEERLSVVLDLSRFRKGEQTRFMTDFCERLYHKNREPLHLVLDEADAWAPQRPLPGQQRLLGAVEDLVRRGRARGIGVTLVTQRAAVLNKDVLTQVEVLVTLRTIPPQDRNAIDEWVKVHGTPEQREELMKSLPSLPIGTAWFWSPGWLDLFKRVTVRSRETFDSSATPKVGKATAAPRRMAEVDLSKLRERIAATIEKAKADDPNELRKRIKELERQLIACPAQHDERAVEQRLRLVTAQHEQEINRAEREAARRYKQMVGIYEKALEELRGKLRKINALSTIDVQAAPAAVPQAAPIASTPAPRPPSLSPTQAAKQSSNDASLSAGERKVMIVVAQYPAGATRQQISILTGYKRSSRDTYVQRLRVMGYVECSAEKVIATEAGIDALGDGYEPLPTGEALREHWLKELPEGERKVLEVVIGHYPEWVAREAIDERTGYRRSSRDTYIQRLRARLLVEVTGRGFVKASNDLFDFD